MTDTQPINFKQKFQDLRRLEKDLEEKKGRGLLLQELFAGQGWYLAFLKQKLLVNRKKEASPSLPIQPVVESVSIPLEEIVPSEMDTTLSALEVFAASNIAPSTPVEKIIADTPKSTFNTTLKLAAETSISGHLIRFNLPEAVFQPMPFNDKDDCRVDLLVVGSPEKESHGKAENNFAEEKWSLLGKMLKSMDLEGQRIAFSVGVDFDPQTKEVKHDRFCQELRLLRPKLILALGATACNMLLLRRERLSQVHGQIFTNELKFSDGHDFHCFFMPIYHPDFLLINPNMKRATWEDLKQAVLFLKSLP
ncbi:MAG: hypothetical protein A2X86_14260 [Bdellovibrionales bacterium GWA2_49_15]|nr:MAG: hypothetical protein A2X86_14260 [Bdellovibrionales bacterium GWA2_49_15]HAZ14073.1 hypothetical protein [Bdellovibrionales bacterium]